MAKSKLSGEVAEASRVLENDLDYKQTRPRTTTRLIVDYAKKLEREQSRARKLRADLRKATANIRHLKRMLKGMEG